MKKNILPFIGIAAAAIIAVTVIGVMSQDTIDKEETSSNSVTLGQDKTGDEYEVINSILKESLETKSISMSSPLKLSGESLEEYCQFFKDEEKQKLVEYCTSTELLDSDGQFLGNIHVVGSTQTPKLIMTLIQVDPFMNQIDDVEQTFNVVITEMVCDCWSDVKPDGFEDVKARIDALKEFHLDAKKTTSKSKAIDLEGKLIQIELTTNFEGYLWKLLVEN